MDWKEFLKPTKEKIVLSIFIILVWIGIGFLLNALRSDVLVITLPGIGGSAALETFIIIFGVCLETLLIYPFASALYNLWHNRGKKISTRKTIFCLLVFNPLSIAIILNIIYFLFLTGFILPQYTNCGIKILNVLPNSPAQQAGLHAGLLLASVNGQIVETESKFFEVLKNTKPGDKFFINSYLNDSLYTKLEGNGLMITLGKHPSNASYGYLGIEGRQGFTKNGYPCKQ